MTNEFCKLFRRERHRRPHHLKYMRPEVAWRKQQLCEPEGDALVKIRALQAENKILAQRLGRILELAGLPRGSLLA